MANLEAALKCIKSIPSSYMLDRAAKLIQKDIDTKARPRLEVVDDIYLRGSVCDEYLTQYWYKYQATLDPIRVKIVQDTNKKANSVYNLNKDNLIQIVFDVDNVKACTLLVSRENTVVDVQELPAQIVTEIEDLYKRARLTGLYRSISRDFGVKVTKEEAIIAKLIDDENGRIIQPITAEISDRGNLTTIRFSDATLSSTETYVLTTL